MTELIIVGGVAIISNLIMAAMVYLNTKSHEKERAEWGQLRETAWEMSQKREDKLFEENRKRERDMLDRLMAKDFTELSLIRRVDEAPASGTPRPSVITDEDELRYADEHGLT